MDSEGKRFTR